MSANIRRITLPLPSQRLGAHDRAGLARDRGRTIDGTVVVDVNGGRGRQRGTKVRDDARDGGLLVEARNQDRDLEG